MPAGFALVASSTDVVQMTLPVRRSGSSKPGTVNANTNATGNLRYSVTWGDEGMFRMLSARGSTQASSTFTHTYAEAGTYAPKFTVTDVDSGKSASVSATVVVTK